eukprot:g81718.t1
MQRDATLRYATLRYAMHYAMLCDATLPAQRLIYPMLPLAAMLLDLRKGRHPMLLLAMPPIESELNLYYAMRCYAMQRDATRRYASVATLR